jgi:serine/threonine-protein kinase 24/25/MST4
LVLNKKTKKQQVIKVLECFNDDEAEECYQEISFMDKFNSPFIVALDSNFLDGNSVFIVMEYCSNGDVSQLIKKCKSARTFIPEWVYTSLLRVDFIFSFYWIFLHK